MSQWMENLTVLEEQEVHIDEVNRENTSANSWPQPEKNTTGSLLSEEERELRALEEREDDHRKVNNRRPVTGVKCSECECIFEDRVELRDHFRFDHGFNFFCKLPCCSAMFVNKTGLVKHLKQRHVGFNFIPCSMCKFWTYREALFAKHHPNHTIAKVACEKCSETFYSAEECAIHDGNVHVNKFQCFYCDKPMHMEELQEHTSKNTQCSFCSAKFRCQNILKDHLANHGSTKAPKKSAKKKSKRCKTLETAGDARLETKDTDAVFMESEPALGNLDQIPDCDVMDLAAIEELETNLDQNGVQDDLSNEQNSSSSDDGSSQSDDSGGEESNSAIESQSQAGEKYQDELYTMAQNVVDSHGKKDLLRRMVKDPGRQSKACKLQKSMREAGLGYEKKIKNKDGSVTIVKKAGRKMLPSCGPSANCWTSKLFNCSSFTQEIREKIFRSFWESSWEAKRGFVISLVQISTPVRQPQIKGRVSFVSKYHLFNIDGQSKLRVCQKMFQSTIGLSKSTVSTWLRLKKQKIQKVEDKKRCDSDKIQTQKGKKKVLCAFLISLTRNTTPGNSAPSVGKQQKWKSLTELWRHYCMEVENPVGNASFLRTFKSLKLSLSEIVKN